MPHLVLPGCCLASLHFLCDASSLLDFQQDYERTLSELPNLIDNYTVPYERWNHVDFLWAKDIDTLLHPRVLQNLEAGERQFS